MKAISDFKISEDFLEFLGKVDLKSRIECPEKKYFGIINCESAPAWNNIYEGLYQGHLQKEHEIWRSFNISKGVIPSESDVQNISGWVVTGSHYATYDKSLPWIEDLFKLLNDILESRKNKARILGFCFGHQALAKAFGGETEKMKRLGMLLMKQRIQLTEEFLNKEFVKKSGVSLEWLRKEGVLLNQAHGDHVSMLPPNATLYGFL